MPSRNDAIDSMARHLCELIKDVAELVKALFPERPQVPPPKKDD